MNQRLSISDRIKPNLVKRLSLAALAVLFIPALICSEPGLEAQLPINLRSTSRYVVLAGSLISNIPGSDLTGDIGLSPAAGSNITGFGREEVTGDIFTVDATGPAGSSVAATDLSTAKGDLTLAYNEAAERTPVPVGPFLNPGAGNIGGLTLVPGLYKFTSGLAIEGSDLTLRGNPDDVWIFQIASDLNVGNGIMIILAGGAQAANVFWQVGTSATLGTTSVFQGTILADQSISLKTGARLIGRALASIAAVTLASNSITKPELVVPVITGNPNRLLGISLQRTEHALEFAVPAKGQVVLKILDAQGRDIAVLFNGRVEAGKSIQVPMPEAALSMAGLFSVLEFHDGIFGSQKLVVSLKI